MFRLLLVILALIAAYMFIQSLPDIQRYLKIRAM
jgi:hypothetical protein